MVRRPGRLVAIATAACVCAVVGRAPPAVADEFDVRLHSRTLSTPLVDPDLVRAMRSTPRPKLRVVLRFGARLTADERDAIAKAGIQLLSPLGNHGYVASIPRDIDLQRGDLRDAGGALAGLRGADLLGPADRLGVGLRPGEQPPTWAEEPPGPRTRVLVQFHPDADADEVRSVLDAVGGKGRQFGSASWALIVDPNQLARLGESDAVKRVEPGPPPLLPLGDMGRLETGTAEAQRANFFTTRPTYRYHASAVKIGIFDSGIDSAHDDFDEVTSLGTAGGSRVAPQRPASSHGTVVASIAAGSGLNSAAAGLPDFLRRGHAPYARIGDYATVLDPNFVIAIANAITNDGVMVSNHSYVQTENGTYGVLAAELDAVVRGDATLLVPATASRPQVWSAGNNGWDAQYGTRTGYYSVFTSAKNTLSIGSIDTLDGQITRHSSLGPTLDGRIKPDLVAPGCQDWYTGLGIRAARTGTQGYTSMCSTSAAAPSVAGAIAVLMHREPNQPPPPVLASTYKAVLVQTAVDRIKTGPDAQEFVNPDTGAPVLYHHGPDFATGWGLVDAERARELIEVSEQWKEDEIEKTANVDEWCVEVPVGSAAIKVTLAWDDAPGDTTGADVVPKLVNDLDLSLVDPTGSYTIRPWTLDPLADSQHAVIPASLVVPAHRGPDHRNNVEMASFYLPRAGPWRVRVYGFELASPQKYSLATSHPRVTCK